MGLNDKYGLNQIYGITRNPETNEYAIVTHFQNGGNLRRLIAEHHTELTWKKVIYMLRNVSGGLNNVHRRNYHHKDFHSGNILNSIDSQYIESVISDFGMSRPADKNSNDENDKTLYGVIPFVAPEVLRGEDYTKAADIYGFGMIMWELLSGEPPFIDREYDQSLIIDICANGLRPPIPDYAPEPYVTLMKQCWDPIPANRPIANNINEQLCTWDSILEGYKDDVEIKRAFNKEREQQWKARLAERTKNPPSLKASHNLLTSKRLNYPSGYGT